MILVIRLTITKNRVTRKLNTELGTAATILHNLTVTINKSREETGFFTFILRGSSSR